MSEHRSYMSIDGQRGLAPIHYLTWAVLANYGTLCGLEGDKQARTHAATSDETKITCETCCAKLAAIALGAKL